MANPFTPEEVSQILEAFFAAVGTRQYIGARYVPIFGRKDETSIEWDNTKPYEPLTIVLYLGNSYTSRQYVPAGVQITDTDYWAITGNYNAQVEQYRRETARALQAAQDAQNDIDTLLPKSSFTSENTVKDYIDSTIQEVQNDIDTLLPKSAFSSENTVKDYLDNVQQDIDTLLPKNAFSAENTVNAAIENVMAYAQSIIVTPEQYGAKGDGVTDDSNAFADMFSSIIASGKSAIVSLAPNAHYICNINQTVKNTVIYGNNSIIDGGKGSAFAMRYDSHDVEIHNCNFVCDYDISDPSYSNVCLGISSNDLSKEYEGYNIYINNCSFKCGVFGFTADNAANIRIENCVFTDGYYVVENSAGGYHILEQSCKNMVVKNCMFDMGKYSRHAIYVSVNQTKPEAIQSKNIEIYNCIFDQSKMTLFGTARYSPNTPVIMVRAVDNLSIHNCIAYNITGFVSAVSTDGQLNNIKIYNILVDGFVFLGSAQAPSEARFVVSIAGTTELPASADVSNIAQISSEVKSNQAYTFINCNVSVHDLTCYYRIYMNACTVDIYNVKAFYSEAFYITGDTPIDGSIRNITGNNISLFSNTGLVKLSCIDGSLINHVFTNNNGEVRYADERPHLNISFTKNAGRLVVTMPNIVASDINRLHCVNRNGGYMGQVNYVGYNQSAHTVELISYHNNQIVTEDGYYSYSLFLG